MTRKFYFLRLITIFSFVALFSCNQSEQQEITSPESIKVLEQKKKKKDHNSIKGIEIIAEYQANLMKPIDAVESTYKDGYLMTEHQKALKKAANNTLRSSVSNVTWKERGPVNVPGRIRRVVAAPNNSDRWYIGTVGGGIWVTDDAGNTFKNLTDYKIPSLSTSTIAISQVCPETVYVGTGEPFGNLDAVGGIGLLKSNDAGNSWNYLNNTKDFGGIGRLAVNPQNCNNLIVASNNGVYVTQDGGLTFNQTYNGGNVQDLNYAPGNFNIQYAGVNGVGVIKSMDGGLSWSLVFDKANYNTNHQRFELDISPVDPNIVYLSVYTPRGAATVAVNTDFYVSQDAGNSFQLLGFNGNPAAANLITGQGWYDNIITAHPFDKNIFYAGGVVMYKVTITGSPKRGGAFTFEPIAAGYNNERNDYVHVDQHSLFFQIDEAEKKFRLILGNDGGVYSTDYLSDPGTTEGDWSQAAFGLNNTQFYGADKRNGADDYIAGAQDNGTWISFTGGTADEATSYLRAIGGDGFESLWNYNDPNKFIGGSQYNGYVRYVNGRGFNARHPESGAGTSPFYTKIVSSANNPDVLFSVSISGIWRSTDFAETWNLTAIPSAYNPGSNATSALDASVSVSNPDIVWTGSAMTESGSFALHVSKDNGSTFEKTNTFVDPRPDRSHNYFMAGLETSPTNENRAYALFGGQGAAKVLKTEDLGQTWEDISGFSLGEDRGFPDVSIHSMIEMPYDENVIWVGTDIGIFETSDGGLNWSLLTGIPAVSIWQMKIVNDQVVLATHGRGVWSAKISQLSGYEPPTYFAPPVIVTAKQEAIENMNIFAKYRQVNADVTAVKVYLDGEEVAEITENTEQGAEGSYVFENLSEGLHTIGFQAIGSDEMSSIISSADVDVVAFASPAEEVVINTFTPDDVYTFNNEFVINTVGSTVSQDVLNNADHNYQDSRQYRTILKRPITVTASSANFRYEDVALTEFNPNPGAFYDYVTIEATKDLETWVELDKYDAERFPEWTEVYESSPTPSINDDLFKEQTFNLLDYFAVDDVIAIRFRLVSDPLFNSFGWAIRSINAENEPEIVAEEVPDFKNAEVVVYPTISRGEIFIRSNQTMKNSMVEIFNLGGISMFSQNISLYDSSEVQLPLGNLNRGMYLIKITSGTYTSTKRIILM
ncbi:WD40/YVTN/BNR-like repeat-containing protein [Aquimarina intermedia]|uniref:Putative secreted protein (Por secretion system target) n=1 Tax=Aquimarina intermedia TaxID=350814 RepID=A0A5S5BX15_9FLAO|nr:T9SS type A sorting domain-containing protein [Aquimarina intermedia]TYP71544.1 putative secreted protein (Por secretion system target) [Aquimarina intermedia]